MANRATFISDMWMENDGTNKIPALTRHVGKEELNLWWIGKGVYDEFGKIFLGGIYHFCAIKFLNVEV